SGTSTLSNRLRSGIRLKPWKMKPIFWLRRRERASSPRWLTSWPSSRYWPLVKVSSSPAMLRKVVLPEPDGPVTATNSPSRTCRSSERSAWVSTWSVRKSLETDCIWSMGGSCAERWKRGSVDGNALGIAEQIGTGDDDLLARLQAFDDLDLAQAA